MACEEIIRVLQVGMSPYYGGTEAFVMNHYRAIDRTKIQFDFLNVYNEKIACQDEIERMGGRVYCLSMSRRNGLKKYHQGIKAFFEANSKSFDVVHCNYQSLINIDILKYAKKYGVKVRIAHAHNSGYGVEPNIMQKMILSLNRKVLPRYATHYFACSELASKWMFGRDATIIRNAIDSGKFVFSEAKRIEMRKELELNDAFTVIFVGRLDPQKNPLFLLEIFSKIKRSRINSKLIVVGDGILKEKMIEKIAQLQISDDVIMLGSRSDVNELLQAADVFLLPSLFEGLGIVLIEAQASGLPVFTSKNVVPEDVQITELLRFLPLSLSSTVWAETILCAQNSNRIDFEDKIINAGYNIQTSVIALENFYIMMVGDAL